MQLTVLGCFGPYPPAGESCSGYLLRDGNMSVLLDCGNGILSQMRYHVEPWELSAIILSHLHSDHISDVMILRYALMIRDKSEPATTLPVYAPDKPEEEFGRLSYKDYVHAQAITGKTSLRIGDVQFSFYQGKHYYPAYFIKAEARGKKLVYSGDTEYFPEMADIIAGADLFLCEANYLRRDLESGGVNHLAAFQAAEAAKRAGVGKLVLTHHHPERDVALALAEAREIFPATEVARKGSFYIL